MPPRKVLQTLKWWCKRTKRAPAVSGITEAMAALTVAKEPEAEVLEEEQVQMEEQVLKEEQAAASTGEDEKKPWWKWNKETQKYEYFEWLGGHWWKRHIRWEKMTGYF